MKSMRTLLTIIAILFSAQASFPCGNEYLPVKEYLPLKNDSLLLSHLLLPGEDRRIPYWHHGFDEFALNRRRGDLYFAMSQSANLYPENIESKMPLIINALLKKDDYQLLSDYAWLELRTGDKQKAVSLLEELYRRHPNEYNIAANLGTGYELTGNNEKAIELLRKAVSINPASHFGSEWIHINLLEEKIAAKPDYKKIIGLSITDYESYLSNLNYKFPQPPAALKKQIAWQLHERIAFVKAPDPVVAQLVLDFADLVAHTDGITAAKPFYQFAKEYAGSSGDTNSVANLAEARIFSVGKVNKEITGTFRWAAIIWAVPLLAFVFVLLAWLRARRQSRNNENV